MNEDFKQYLHILTSNLFSPQNLIPKQIGGIKITAELYYSNLIKYIKQFESTSPPDIDSLYKSTVTTVMENMVAMHFEMYEKKMTSDIVSSASSFRELAEMHSKFKSETFNSYDNHRKLGTATEKRKFRNQLERKIEDLYDKKKETLQLVLEKLNKVREEMENNIKQIKSNNEQLQSQLTNTIEQNQKIVESNKKQQQEEYERQRIEYERKQQEYERKQQQEYERQRRENERKQREFLRQQQEELNKRLRKFQRCLSESEEDYRICKREKGFDITAAVFSLGISLIARPVRHCWKEECVF
jgi:uncharacterized phage infection (PIP) family protein YhgE